MCLVQRSGCQNVKKRLGIPAPPLFRNNSWRKKNFWGELPVGRFRHSIRSFLGVCSPYSPLHLSQTYSVAGGSCRMGWQSYKNIIYLPLLPPLSHTTCLSPKKTFSLSWLEREYALFSFSSHCSHKQGYHSTGRPKQTTGLAGPLVWILLRCLSHRGLLAFLFYCSLTVFFWSFS